MIWDWSETKITPELQLIVCALGSSGGCISPTFSIFLGVGTPWPAYFNQQGIKEGAFGPSTSTGWSGVLDKSTPNCFLPPSWEILVLPLSRQCWQGPDCSVAGIWETKAVRWEVLPALQSCVASTGNGHVHVPVPQGETGTSSPRAAEPATPRSASSTQAFRHQLKQMKNKICIKYIYLCTIPYRFIMYITSGLDINNINRISIFSVLIALYLYILYYVCVAYF